MSISAVKKSFQDGLGDAAACEHATMSYERDELFGQRLTFIVRKPDGERVTVTEVVPHRSDLIAAARQIAETFKASLGV